MHGAFRTQQPYDSTFCTNRVQSAFIANFDMSVKMLTELQPPCDI